MHKDKFPSFSIVLPVFKGEDFIVRAIESLIAQDYPKLELLFIDGGSPDDTVRLAENYREHFAYFVSEPDKGQTDALNKGFALACGDIFGWLCHDDTLEPGALHDVARLFQENPDASLITGASRRVYDDGFEQVMVPRPDVLERVGFQNGIEQPATFWKADFHRRAGELDESFNHAMDWDWWCRLRRAGAHAVVTEKIYANYYFPINSKTSSNPDSNLAETYRIVKNYGPYDGLLADAYSHIYENFDLKGCFDPKAKVDRKTRQSYTTTMDALKRIFGEEYINSYNWQWIAKQKRGKIWR